MATTANPALTYRRSPELTRSRSRTDSDLSARARGADRAFQLLRVIFTVAPIAFGLDKFAGFSPTGSSTSPRGWTASSPGPRIRRCWRSAWWR